MTGIDYLSVVRSAPALLLLLRPDKAFTIVDASDGYLRATLRTREEIVGRGLFEVFPDNPDLPDADGTANLRASLTRVLSRRKPDEMPTQRYDIPRPAPLGGFEQRWWNPVNAPVLDAAGQVVLIVHRVEDATELMRLQAAEQSERERAVRNLRATEILDSTTEGFFSLDRQFRFTFVNRAGTAILSREAGKLLGSCIWDIYPGLENSEFGVAYHRAMEQREASSFTAFYEGHQLWYDVHAHPAPDGISVYFRDVTEQKNAAAASQRLAAESDRQRRIYEVALSNTPDLVYIFDLDHRFVYANEALLAMWGRTREDAIGKNCLELGYAEWHAAMHDREIEQVVATRKPIRGEVPFVGTAGRRVWDYIFVPVLGPDGDVVAIAGTSRDTTDARAAHEEIEAQSEQLRQADRAKDEFIATLSHELRNPLAPLRNAVALLKLNPPPPQAARMNEMMERQLNHLVRLVDDLLEVSRVSRGDFTLRRETVQLAAVMRNAVETTEPAVQARQHSLAVSIPEEPIWVQADPVRLAQVICNLIDNAVKYTPPGGRIDVSVERHDGTVQVRVQDNGAGISPELLHRIFEMFNRGDRGNLTAEGGLGIGLALAKRLAEMHGARLEAHSDGAGKGSVFTLSLPSVSAPAAQRAA